MPIQRCNLPGGEQGYKWGDQGTCYADRGKAVAQAQAAYASGYTKKSNNALEHPPTAFSSIFTPPQVVVLEARQPPRKRLQTELGVGSTLFYPPGVDRVVPLQKRRRDDDRDDHMGEDNKDKRKRRRKDKPLY
jgi:hypothetical protein